MSCPGPYKIEGGSHEKPATALNADDMKRKKEAELLKKYVERLTKLESTFTTIMTGILKRYSQHVVDPLKVLLECPICQELVIEAVTRPCSHTFCNHCFTKWLENSNDCPICRGAISLAAKNPLIDKIVDLLIEASFTKLEKKERDQRIQQHLAAAVAPKDEIEQLDPNSTIPMLGRTSCIIKARSLIRDVFSNKKLFNELRGKEDFQPVSTLLKTFSIELDSLLSAQKALPDSLFDLEYFMKHHMSI